MDIFPKCQVKTSTTTKKTNNKKKKTKKKKNKQTKKNKKKTKQQQQLKSNGESGCRSRYLSHAKRALYHLS